MKPSIAILIPCYNSALYLPELFEGIRAQTIPFDEIICYDDYSTDHTIEVAERLGAKVLRGKQNHGPAYARNRMTESTTCDFIHFHDSDDLIDAAFIETMQSSIVDENIQLLCNTYVYDRATRKHNLGDITYQNLLSEPDQLRFFLENVGFASMGLYSKKALKSIGGFREDLKGNEDPDLHIRLSQKGYKIMPIDNYLVTKLEHEDSFSHQNWKQCLADKLSCLETYSSQLSKAYHPILGKQAAGLSNYFYREHDAALSKRARQLAYKCGAKEVEAGIAAKIISKLFGIGAYLWIYRRRVDLHMA